MMIDDHHDVHNGDDCRVKRNEPTCDRDDADYDSYDGGDSDDDDEEEETYVHMGGCQN